LSFSHLSPKTLTKKGAAYTSIKFVPTERIFSLINSLLRSLCSPAGGVRGVSKGGGMKPQKSINVCAIAHRMAITELNKYDAFFTQGYSHPYPKIRRKLERRYQIAILKGIKAGIEWRDTGEFKEAS